MNNLDYLHGWAAGSHGLQPKSFEPSYADGFADGLKALALIKARTTIHLHGGMHEPVLPQVPMAFDVFNLARLVA